MELIVCGLVVVYTGGVWKFLNGFNRTNFQRTLPNRLSLALLWPALFVSSKNYRQNFRKALKGQK
ncbi:MAG: hypothetical protein HC862_04495 [Scytonema sp. RU_4_4]|nr:hypothetical protein [Scytonema sp. RU_4_4]NJR72798.1 hypothetical protein [Scytonema sp. CRU_2_7]